MSAYYTPHVRMEFYRRWSILWELHRGFFNSAFLFRLNYKEKSNFWLAVLPNYPMLPLFAVERVRAQRIGNVATRMSRGIVYALTVKWPETTEAGSPATADVVLDCLADELAMWLDGREIPVYTLPGFGESAIDLAGGRLEEKIRLQYLRDSRRPEQSDADRNLLRIEFGVEI